MVASALSFLALPSMASYAASKAGVEMLALAYRQEVAHLGITVSLVHPSWIDTDLVRESEQDLPSFKEAKSKLPWPLKSTTSVEACAKAIVDGFEARKARVFVPKAAVLAYLLRTVITSSVGERISSDDAETNIPRMERDIEALGRSGSARTTKINDLESTEAAEVAER